MTNFTEKDLDRLQKLARIRLKKEEERELLNHLEKILGYIESLDEVNTDDVKPLSFVTSEMVSNVMRDDEVNQPLSRETFLENAPDQISGMIKTPPVLSEPA